ncbi:MAG: hypothetical protein HON68_10390 [Gammaproteobacteria bacterium]|jgi:hypothetical protein|nr:hypothetical protein [Gammaproteobacteria bacterium]MBT3489626.1 hypothetical protein [Gammaproteobacteria bacterium]MBT3718464.1 hypothetical protein [Gammaproteobacteria bacterium]MBT3843937.1 hypothetical protein [Gammaproteobacteria bacterium]MBT3893439.1 hypothetical protein [Gammaproteobacteria bacterium]
MSACNGLSVLIQVCSYQKKYPSSLNQLLLMDDLEGAEQAGPLDIELETVRVVIQRSG